MTTVEDFKSLSAIEHVRHRSDLYIGSIKNSKEVRWIINEDKEGYLEAENKELEYNPGLEQCVLELITNAADHAQRCKTLGDVQNVTKIKINWENDHVCVWNNGEGIPIAEKDFKDDNGKTTLIYIPEMIFGNLRTSSNYDDTQKKTWGGRNGIGSKACNIFGVKFVVELQTGGKKYYQEFSEGMTKKTPGKITGATTKGDYTKIIYYPDFKAFGMKDFLSNDTPLLIKKRVYDLSAATGKDVDVFLNEVKVPIKDFSDYMTLFIGQEKKVVYKTDRWEVGFALCPYDLGTQISFVNAIATEDGGTHVSHILDPVLTKITAELQVKAKGVTIKKQYIKDNVIVFIKALIENPSFDSQLKRKLNTKFSDFGSRCDIPDDVIKKISKLGICDNVMKIAEAKEMKDAMKKIDGTKSQGSLGGIKKLHDANWAGTGKSRECTLILTEGDSAAGLARNGIPAAGGTNKWGIFPLRGKFLNVRSATAAQLIKNEEIIAINRIMGLKDGLKDISKLRYGKVMLMTDSDVDGGHIKGLLINYFTFYWPELVHEGLLEFMTTPLVKVFKGTQTLKEFYSMNDFKKWKELNPGPYREKYYKGLGTSTAAESKEYFMNLGSNRKGFKFNEDRDLPIIERTFDKDYADARKDWITTYLKNGQDVDYTKKTFDIDYFINHEFVQFSVYDNVRSIPNIVDGLKPSQRKILYSCLKKKLFLKTDGSGEIKVAQLSGTVSELSEYHHGEQSLQGTIVGMAQDFVGSNNLNLLLPKGNFGSRQSGGDDAASSRYIFTALNPVVKIVFNEIDNKLLKYLEEDGRTIEPEYYIPIIPMILINGSQGIGSGWSTNIPCFKLEDIIDNLKLLINDEDSVLKEMNPWYKGFKGQIIKESANCWKSVGIITYINKNTVEVTELPVGMWKEDFKEHLDKLMDAPDTFIKQVLINDDDSKKSANDVCYQIKLKNDITREDLGGLIKLFKLEKNINGTNMIAFDQNHIIQKYGSVADILWEFYIHRLKFYDKRYTYLKDTLSSEIHKVSEKLRFVILVIEDKIVVFKRKKADISEDLIKYKFVEQDEFLKMPLHKFTREEVLELQEELDKLKEEFEVLITKTPKDLWLEDLDKLSKFI